MKYSTGSEMMSGYRREIGEIRQKMRKAQAEIEPQDVTDYVFASSSGPVRLSELFDKHDDLMVIHNMGRSCPACTLWADGYNGIHPHVISRAAFVVSSPDAPEVQQAFAASRGWKFPMVSHQGTSFAADMGYASADGRWRPGISVFRRQGTAIQRVSDTQLRPGDDFCTLWHFFDLLPEGAAGWTPKFSYS
jgi:predicted dithiol-disulfide oxidoreductase (DUF899 family)